MKVYSDNKIFGFPSSVFEGEIYFNRENLVTFLNDGLVATLLCMESDKDVTAAKISARARNGFAFISRCEKRAEKSGYRVREFLKNDQTLSKKKVRK